MGPASIRASVPWRRSSNRLSIPDWTAKNRNRTAIAEEKNVAQESWRRSAPVSTSAIAGCWAAATIAAMSAPAGGVPRRSPTVSTASWTLVTPSANRAATERATSVARPASFAPRITMDVG